MFYKSGQLWGMPPYNWKEMKKDNYAYIKERLRYAENFFDMFRIDHFIGLFRIWTVKKTKRASGRFDPEDERKWEEHGRKILNVIVENTKMLPTAEDLGTVPDCSPKVLREYGICGTDWHAYHGRQPFFTYPRILGHELGVEVVSVNDSGSHLKAGDRCAVEPYLNCGRCVACRRGMTNCCATARPSPVPECFVVNSGSKMNGNVSVGIPQPVSPITTRTPPVAIAPIASSGWPGTPIFRTRNRSSGALRWRATSAATGTPPRGRASTTTSDRPP